MYSTLTNASKWYTRHEQSDFKELRWEPRPGDLALDYITMSNIYKKLEAHGDNAIAVCVFVRNLEEAKELHGLTAVYEQLKYVQIRICTPTQAVEEG